MGDTMSTSPELPELTTTEYDILRVVWKAGEQSVREVHDALDPTYGWAYTTTKTIMDRMVAKRLLRRKPIHGVLLYAARISRPVGVAKLVHFFASRVLEVERDDIVEMLIKSETMSADEIRELAHLLECEHLSCNARPE